MTATTTTTEEALRAECRKAAQRAMRDYSAATLRRVAKQGYAAVFGPGDGGIPDKTWVRLFREEFEQAARETARGR